MKPILAWWRGLALTRQFVLMAILIMVATMVVLGTWVSSRIEEGALRHAAAASAGYMKEFVQPLVQDLATSDNLKPASAKALDALHKDQLDSRVVAIKIWRPDGTIVYSTMPQIIGRRFPKTPRFQTALAGEAAAEFDSLEDDENVLERDLGKSVIEIYVPMREATTGRIIAVAEFYEAADPLYADLRSARIYSWVVVGGLGALMIAAFQGVFQRAENTIISQQAVLENRVEDLASTLEQDSQLREAIAVAGKRRAEADERFLRRVGADLHDGPAQLIGLALLRLDVLRSHIKHNARAAGEERNIRESLVDALSDIRNISSGLALPELETMTIEDSVFLAVRNHERRTGTSVQLTMNEMPDFSNLAAKTCIYRFVQEGLNNAYRHAGGKQQVASLEFDGDDAIVIVKDGGAGGVDLGKLAKHEGLGLKGLRDRIESLGGRLEIDSKPGRGTKLVMQLNVGDDRDRT